MDIMISVNNDPFLLFFGGFFLVMGVSIFFSKEAWEEYLDMLSKSKALLLIGGVINLPIGLFIVTFYNNWNGLAETVLMAVGILALVKSVILLTKPDYMQKLLATDKLTIKPFWMNGVAASVVGAILLVL